MKYLLCFLTTLPLLAAEIKISDLSIISSPSTNTFIEVADLDATPKSRKYLLSNLFPVSGTVVNSGTPVDTAVPIYSGTTGTNITPSSVTVGSLTNLNVPGKLTITSGTVTASTPPVDVTQTWNAGGTTFIGPSIDITDTASAAASKAFRIRGGAAGTTELFSVDKSGTALASRLNAGTFGDANGVAFSSSFGVMRIAGGILFFTNNDDCRLARSSSGFVSLGNNSTAEIIYGADAANTLQLGSDSATAAAQVLKGPDGSGTDKVGGSLTLAGGKSTGTGAGGAVILQTANSSATGSSANTLSERFHAPAKFVDLTESTATTLFTIPVAAAGYVGLTATITVFASDGTDHQALTSTINVNGVAKTTTITPTVTQVDGTTAASSGTLTCTYTVTDNTSNVMAVKANAVSSLTQTTLRAKIVITAINSNGAATVTEL